jgi:predicted ArsR family transcriptional regulator
MTTLQQQARALGDPTRHAVFRYIVAADHDVDVAELTAHFAVNHNAVRQHLAKLVEARLVVESQATPQGRGRPRLLYRVAPSADSRWGATGPYERLSWLLAEIVRSGESAIEVGRRSVSDRPPAGAGVRDPIDVLVFEMARGGFEPAVRRRGDRVEIVLQTCPFESTAQVNADAVCDLHLGMAQGIAAVVDGLAVDDLVRADPRRANCRLRCRVTADGPRASRDGTVTP